MIVMLTKVDENGKVRACMQRDVRTYRNLLTTLLIIAHCSLNLQFKYNVQLTEPIYSGFSQFSTINQSINNQNGYISNTGGHPYTYTLIC